MLNTISAILNNGVSAVGDYESIQTITVGAGGAASVTFSSIATDWTHLQVRGICRSSRATYGDDNMIITFNSDSGTNYAKHALMGDGASASAGANANSAGMSITMCAGNGAPANTFGVVVFDILDYKNTNKYKTSKFLGGMDINGTVAGYGGYAGINSGVWLNTNAISSIKIAPVNPNFLQYSQFALYGVK